jgi:sugar (pentulose or hexulose) kinase
MSPPSLTNVAVIDIGKTNAKVAVVDTVALREIGVRTKANAVRPGPPYPHVDIEGLWAFILDSLGELHARHRIDAISVTAHGASIMVLDRAGDLACPMLDYEHTGPDELADAYDRLRPPFEETGSPRLPRGLNAGAQLHWLLETQGGLAARIATVVTYPQYWSGRLSGIFRCECTSLGSHSDLWNPWRHDFSALPARLGLHERMAPLERAAARLGPILPDVARATGLPAGTPVACGIHDSNSALLPHLMAREPPFAVVSTGTWVISMAVGGRPATLDPRRDTLVNVDAFGRPTPSARFMGGREFDLMRGETDTPDAAEVAAVLGRGAFLLPSVEPTSGPFPGARGRWSDPAMTPAEKSAALSFYLALMTAECLGLIGAEGQIVVEGPFGGNPLFLDMLSHATGRPVGRMGDGGRASLGAALLADGTARGGAPAVHRPTLDPAVARDYAAAWARAARAG